MQTRFLSRRRCSRALKPTARSPRQQFQTVRRPHSLYLLPIALLACTPTASQAQTDYWQGGNTNEWDVAANWTPGVPTSTNDVVNNTDGSINFDSITVSINSFLNSGNGGFNLSSGTLNVSGNVINTGSGKLTFSGGTLNVGGNFQSSGAVNLSGSVLSGSGAATSAFEVDNTLTLESSGTLSNFTINPGSGQGNTLTIVGGTLSHDTLNQSLVVTSLPNLYNSTVTLDTLTVNGDLSIVNYNNYGNNFAFAPNSLTVSGKTTLGNNNSHGFLVFSNPTASDTSGMNEIVLGGTTYTGYEGALEQTNGNTLTITPNTVVHGAYGYIGYNYNGADTLINQGVINSDVSGGTLNINATTFTNTGTLQATNGGRLNLSYSTGSLSNFLTADGANSTLYLNGSSTVGSNLTFTSSNGGNIYLQGTLDGGGNAFTIASGALTVEGSSTLQNATVNLNSGAQGVEMVGGTLSHDMLNQSLVVTSLSGLPNSNVTLDTLSVNGDLSIVNYNGNGTNYAFAPNSLTVSGKTTLGNNNSHGFLVFSNPTASDTSGMNEIVLGGTTYTGYEGALFQTNGNTLTITPNTLVHGAYGYIGYNYNGADTLLNQGVINSDVSGGTLNINATTFTNTGTLQATNGGRLNVQSQTTSLAAGNIYVGTGSTITVNNSVTRTSGTTTIDGGFTVPSGQSVSLQGGLLTGTGTINGDLANSGGTVRPGDLLGALTINGNFTQSGGITEIDLGGAMPGTLGQLNVTNLAQLGGELDVKVEPGSFLTVGETFDFLTYGSLSGSFNTIVALDPGFSYSVTYGNGGNFGEITVNTIGAGVPETSTFVTAALMLGAGGLLLRRRRQATQTQPQAA